MSFCQQQQTWKIYQAVVVINGVPHVHSEVFGSKKTAIESLLKNNAYEAIEGFITHHVGLDQVDLKAMRKKP